MVNLNPLKSTAKLFHHRWEAAAEDASSLKYSFHVPVL